jgi:hypothetical protein
MADLNEPKKGTVRIGLPPQSVSKPPGPDTKSRETVRIQLAPRQPSDKLPVRAPTEPLPASKAAAQDLSSRVFPPPPPLSSVSTEPSPVSMPVSPAPAPVTLTPGALSSGPKKETARIPLMPDSPSKPLPTVQMKKTQPLIAMPPTAPQSASIAVAPAEKGAMPLCWVLLGVSVTILIIQIWTYFS